MRRLRLAMVGGGPGAFIGGVHRIAAAMDGRFELVAGAFSSNAKRSRSMAGELGLEPERCYGSWQELLSPAELARPDALEVISIVTPNHLHHPVAAQALSLGLPVICDKPMTLDADEARELAEQVRTTGIPFALTHNYSGYPMVREAAVRVARGDLGKVRKIAVQYPQGWLAEPIERDGQKQASWRTDPQRAGAGGCLGDIGTHAAHLAEFVSGLPIEQVSADLHTFVDGRQLDDDVSMLLRFSGGARGVLWSSQVCVGEENSLMLRVYGERGGLVWRQQEPNSLEITSLDAPRQIVRTGGAGLSDEAQHCTRLPAGHPEGFLEAFANLYRDFADVVQAWQEKAERPLGTRFLPNADDGLHGMQFVEAAVGSSSDGGAWTRVR